MCHTDAGAIVETGQYQFDSAGANKAKDLIGKHIRIIDPNFSLQVALQETKGKRFFSAPAPLQLKRPKRSDLNATPTIHRMRVFFYLVVDTYQ